MLFILFNGIMKQVMCRNPKILHIISSRESGLINELNEFAARLSQNDFVSEICILAGPAKHDALSVPTTTLGTHRTFDCNSLVDIRRLRRRLRPDIIHTWDASAQRFAAVHCGNSRLIAENRDADTLKQIGQTYVDKKTSLYIAPRIDDRLPLNKTIIIPPAAVPMPHAEPMPAEVLLEKLGFPLVEPEGDYYPVFQSQYDPLRRNYVPSPPRQIPFIIGIVLPLRSEHRILDALWVFETFNHVHLNYHTLVIGDGSDRELFLRSRDHWNLFPRVHFLGQRSDTYRLMPSFNVLLHLSPSAEYAGSILSAMSCGVPVIALETPESREYVQDSITGILIPSEGDFRFYRRTTTKRLLYLLENAKLRHSMHTAAKERVASTFNFDTAVQQRIQIYRSLERIEF